MNPFTWLVIFALIAVNALYVAAEFAAVSVRRSRIRQLAEDGHALAARLLPTLDDARKLDQYIAASQIGITLSSLILGAYGQARLADSLLPVFAYWGGLQVGAAESVAAVIVLVGLTVLQVLLGELVPKSLALQYPVQAALYTVLPMRWSLVVFSWFIRVLNGSGLVLLKIFGITRSGHRHIHSPEEIELLLTESRAGGVIEPDEHRRLRQALQLEARPVHTLMVPRRKIAAVDIATPISQVLHMVANSPYTRLPVYRGAIDHIIGILLTRDLVVSYIEQAQEVALEKLVRPAVFVHENLTADRLLVLLRERHSHQAIVVDEFGGVAGLVTLEDVLARLVGEVGDEFKAQEPQPEQLADGRLRLPGMMRLEEAEGWLGATWQGEADTLGGRVIEELGHLPVAGEQIEINGVQVQVEQVEDHTIRYLLVIPAQPIEESLDG